MIVFVEPMEAAKEISVEGTSRSLKEPDIESFPPMAATSRSSWAAKAPSSAATGLPQRLGSDPSLGKYSCRDSQQCRREPPEATTRQTESVTAW